MSDDLDEIELLADRIAVMSLGRLSQARAAAQWSREQLGLAMAGEISGKAAGELASDHGGYSDAA